ncbi:MAG: hypothetical protein KH332_07245 [Firmicutes bacterium]|jgi:hypothetical protein|nr:hypothetical protein [Bacillota bacterium]
MNEILATYSLEIIKAVVLAIFAIIGVYAAKLQTKYIDTDTKRKIAATTVAYIEQVYKDLHGDEKLARALVVAASMLSQKGIKTTEEELKVLLEAAVKEMNDKFKKETAAAQSALEETHNTGFTVKPASE